MESTPSAKFCNVADHWKLDVSPPEMRDGSGDATVPQLGLPRKETVLPWPEDDRLNDIDCVMLSQFIAVLNSNVMSMVVAFVSLMIYLLLDIVHAYLDPRIRY